MAFMASMRASGKGLNSAGLQRAKQLLQEETRVGNHAEIRLEHLANLRALDVHVNELALAAIDRDAAGVAIAEAAAHRQHQVAVQEHAVAQRLADLNAHVSGVQAMGEGHAALGHVGLNDRYVKRFRHVDQRGFAFGQGHAAAHDENGRLGLGEHFDDLGDLRVGGAGLLDGQRLVGVNIEIDFRLLNVQGQIEQNRAGLSGAHQMERLTKNAGQFGRVGDAVGLLGDGLADFGDVDALEGILVQLPGVGLPGDGQEGDGIDVRRVEAGGEIGRAGPGGADGQRDFVAGAIVRVRRVGAGFLMAHAIVGDRRAVEVFIDRVDARAGDAERVGNSFFDEDLD